MTQPAEEGEIRKAYEKIPRDALGIVKEDHFIKVFLELFNEGTRA